MTYRKCVLTLIGLWATAAIADDGKLHPGDKVKINGGFVCDTAVGSAHGLAIVDGVAASDGTYFHAKIEAAEAKIGCHWIEDGDAIIVGAVAKSKIYEAKNGDLFRFIEYRMGGAISFSWQLASFYVDGPDTSGSI